MLACVWLRCREGVGPGRRSEGLRGESEAGASNALSVALEALVVALVVLLGGGTREPQHPPARPLVAGWFLGAVRVFRLYRLRGGCRGGRPGCAAAHRQWCRCR